MDGVIYRGRSPIPEALDFLRRFEAKHIPYLLLTNHSCLTPLGFSKKLAKMGIKVPASRIYSSAEATAEWLANRKARAVYMIGEEGLAQALKRLRIRRQKKNVSHVVVGLDRQITYEHLTTACRLITAGAAFIGTNPDPIYPVEDGVAPECGALLAAIENVTGKKPTVIGKPDPGIYHQAAKRLGMPIRQLAMIGDRLDTDILGAQRSGARSILVLTGHTTRASLRNASISPDRVVKSLREVEID